MPKAGVKKVSLKINDVLVTEYTRRLHRKGGGVISVPVSIFRNEQFIQKNGKKISRDPLLISAAAVSNLYALSLEAVAESYEQGKLPEANMQWPAGASNVKNGIGKGGARNASQRVTMRTGIEAGLDETADTSAIFPGYTSSTLETYRRTYGYRVPGYPFRKDPGKRRRDVARARRAAGNKRFHYLTGGSSENIVGSIGIKKDSRGIPTAQSAGQQLARQRIKLDVKYKPLKGKLPRTRHRKGVPIHVVTGRMTGFEQAVKLFPAGNEIFALPFSEPGYNPQTEYSVPNLKAAVKGSAAVRARALLALNERRRPYIRMFMTRQHKRILGYVQKQLGLVQ